MSFATTATDEVCMRYSQTYNSEMSLFLFIYLLCLLHIACNNILVIIIIIQI